MPSPLPKLTFTVQIFKEGKQCVSFNPELRVASCGKTPEEVKKNLPDSYIRTDLYFLFTKILSNFVL